MRRAVYPAVVVAILALLSLGASCGDDATDPTPPRADPSSGGTPEGRVEELPQVDVSSLTRGERRMWVDLVNDQLSPCGDPVSVARCVSESRACSRCVPAARYLSRLVTEGYEKSEIEEHFEARYGRESAVELDLAGAPVRGAPMAPITIVEFSDFECPYCAATAPVLERLLREHEGQIRLVFRHYPLDGHERALPAARASVAAGNQGKFWEMHDRLFEGQDALEQEDLERYAGELGLDLERFRRDLSAEETQRRVEADKAAGREIGVTGTPTILVNGRRFREPARALGAYLREEMDQ